MKRKLLESRQAGFTLAELLVALAISGVILAAVSSAFLLQRKAYDVQEQVAEMVGNARAAMDMIVREVRMAGCNPLGASFYGIPYSATQLQILSDLNGDGDTADANENIIYTFDATYLQIDRNTGGGAQPMAENIQSFTFEYLDSTGNPTTTTANIRQVRITITARTSEPDPDYSQNGGYRTYTLTSLVVPQNLGL